MIKRPATPPMTGPTITAALIFLDELLFPTALGVTEALGIGLEIIKFRIRVNCREEGLTWRLQIDSYAYCSGRTR